jgi:hypothetical protein
VLPGSNLVIYSGQLISIVNASTLPQVISSKSIETILLEKIISLHQKDIAEQVLKKDVPVGDVTKTLYSKLQKDDLRVDTCIIESIYEDSIQGEINAKIWHDAENIADGRNSITKVKNPSCLKPLMSSNFTFTFIDPVFLLDHRQTRKERLSAWDGEDSENRVEVAADYL